MAKDLKRELSLSIQYFLMAFIALIAPYLKWVFGSEAINLTEAWKNIDPYLKTVLLIFLAMCVVRLLAVFILRSGKKSLE